MKRRITEAIVGVSALILVALGIPLALAIHQSIVDSEVVELQADAARTLAEIQVPLDPVQLASVNEEPDAPPAFSVYDADGRLVFGDGPALPDSAVLQALHGNTASTTNGEIVVATPVIDDATEQTVGALRLAESLDGANHRSRQAWLIMGASGVAALSLGWLVANRLARRLSQPVIDLAAFAARLGDGGRIEPMASSGIEEIDTLAAAFSGSSQRVNAALARERQFSADVSHQLRTPLTALQLRLETARTSNAAEAIDAALDDLARIEDTVEHLLSFARDSMPQTSTVRLDLAARHAAARWTTRLGAVRRVITAVTTEPITASGSAASVDQILDVLIDNALHHGLGPITITARRVAGGGAIDATDDGGEIESADVERIFLRGEGARTGIGLALARAMAEADGGRLLLTRRYPTTFSLILVDADPDESTPSPAAAATSAEWPVASLDH